MASVLEDLKRSTRDLIEAKHRLFTDLVIKGDQQNIDKELLVSALDIASEARAIYRITEAEVNKAERPEELATLWKETHALFENLLELWHRLFARLNAPKNEPFRYCGEVLANLERASAREYQFYARGSYAGVKLTAVFEACEEGGYHAFIHEISGVHTQGETIKEASENLADALGLFVLDELEDKLAGITPTNRIEVELNFSHSETTRA
jgi:predicted RNase H-like HicB family nuclease